jgi:hypothetical protein
MLQVYQGGTHRAITPRLCDAPPTLDELAPHWLGHMTGSHDHTAECAERLQSLACSRGVEREAGRAPADLSVQARAARWSQHEPARGVAAGLAAYERSAG